MDNNSKLEDLFRQELRQINADAGSNTWDQIAARQQKHNTWLRIRHIGRYAVPMAAALALLIAGWRHFTPTPDAANNLGPSDSAALYTPSGQPVAKPGNPGDAVLVARPTSDDERPTSSIVRRLTSGVRRLTSAVLQPFHFRPNTVPAKTTTFLAENGLDYTSPKTGTKVHIPAGILVDAEGKPVTGKVELVLWEYQKAVDFLASGIPMHYVDERGAFAFNSGGMFDIRLKQNGRELQIAPGQQYEIDIAATHPMTDGRLYHFDETDGQWKYEYNPALSKAGEKAPPVIDEATAIRDNSRKRIVKGDGIACMPHVYLPINEVMNGVYEYAGAPSDAEAPGFVKEAIKIGFDMAVGTEAIPKWYKDHSGMMNEQILSALEQSHIRIVDHHDQMELFFPEDENRVFSELEAFKNGYFEYSKERNKKHFEVGGEWEQISVAQQQGSLCMVSLNGKQGLIQFYANLVCSPEHKDFDVEAAFAEYRRLKEARRLKFKNELIRIRKFMYIAPLFQTVKEYCMEEAEWMQYFEDNKALMEQRYGDLIKCGLADQDSKATEAWHDWKKRRKAMKVGTNTLLPKSMRGADAVGNAFKLVLPKLGLHNLDCIFTIDRVFKGQQWSDVETDFRTPEGKKIYPQTLTCWEQNTDLFFTYPHPNAVPRVPGRKFNLMLTDKQGKSYWVPGDRFAGSDLSGDSCSMTVADVTEKTQTAGGWAELLLDF